MSTASDCRERGWVPGDVVEGRDLFGGPARVRITAIGLYDVLAVDCAPPERESAWSISWREWRRVEEAPGPRDRCPACLAAVRAEERRWAGHP